MRDNEARGIYKTLKNGVKKKIPEWIRLANAEEHARMPRMIVVDDVEEAGRLRRRYPDTLVVHSPQIYDKYARRELTHSEDPLEIRLSNNDKIKGILVKPESLMLAMSKLYQDWMEPPKDLNQVVNSLEDSVEKAVAKRQRGMDGLQKAAMNLSGKKDPQKIRKLINWILKHQFEFPEHFIREAVQNADGAYENKKDNRIDVYIDTANRQVRIEDQGMAMTSETIDDKFFNMFKSDNEHLDFAAGKFGIGAVSFFGLDHESVEIDSLTEAGEGSRVVVNKDLMKGDYLPSNRTGHGTTVTINLSEQSDIDFNKVKEILEQDCCYIETPLYLHMDGSSRQLNRELFPNDAMTFQESNAQGFLQKYGNGGELHLLDHRIRLKTLPIKGANGVVNCDGLSTTFSRDSIKDDAVFKDLWSFINLKRKKLYQNEAVDYTKLPIGERLKRYSHFVQESLFVEDGKANEEWIQDNFSTLKNGERFREGLSWKSFTNFSFFNKWSALPSFVYDTLAGLVSAPYKIVKAYVEEDRDITLIGPDIDLSFLATEKPEEKDIQTIVDNELRLEGQLENIIIERNRERKHKVKRALDGITKPLPNWYNKINFSDDDVITAIVTVAAGLGGASAGFLSGFPKTGLGIAAASFAYSVPLIMNTASNIAKGIYGIGYNAVQAVNHWLKKKVLNEEITKKYNEVAAGFKKPKESVTSYKKVKPKRKSLKLNLRQSVSKPIIRASFKQVTPMTREEIAKGHESFDPIGKGYVRHSTYNTLEGLEWRSVANSKLRILEQNLSLPSDLKVDKSATLNEKLWAVYNHLQTFEYDAVPKEYAEAHGSLLEAIVNEKKVQCMQANTLAAHYLNKLGVENIRLATGEFKGGSHAWLEVEIDNEWYISDFTPREINKDLAAMLPFGRSQSPFQESQNIFEKKELKQKGFWGTLKSCASFTYNGIKKHGVTDFVSKILEPTQSLAQPEGFSEWLATAPLTIGLAPFKIYRGMKEQGIAEYLKGCLRSENTNEVKEEPQKLPWKSMIVAAASAVFLTYGMHSAGFNPFYVKQSAVISMATPSKDVSLKNANEPEVIASYLLPKTRKDCAEELRHNNLNVPPGYFAMKRFEELKSVTTAGCTHSCWNYAKKGDVPQKLSIEQKVLQSISAPKKRGSSYPETLEGKLALIKKQFNTWEYDVITFDNLATHGGMLKAAQKLKKGTCADINTLAAVHAYQMGIRNARYVTGFLNGGGHAWLEFERVGKWHIVDFTPKKVNPELAKIMPKHPATWVVELDQFSRGLIWANENAFVYAKVKEGDTRWKFATGVKKWTGVKRKDILDRIPLSKEGYLRKGIYEIGRALSLKDNRAPSIIDENGEKHIIEPHSSRYSLNDKFQFCGRTWNGHCVKPLSEALEGLKVMKGKVFADVKKGDTRFGLANILKRVAGSYSTWQNIADRMELRNGDFATGKYEVGRYIDDRVVIADKIKRYVEPVKVEENIDPDKLKNLPKKDGVELMPVPEKLNLPVQSESIPNVPYQDNTHLYLLGMGLLCGAVYLGTRKSERLDELNRDQRVTIYSLAESLPEVDIYYTDRVSSAFDLSKKRVRLNPEKSIIPEIAALGYATFMRDEALAKTVAERYGK